MVTTVEKAALITSMSAAGTRRFDAVSFVNPAAVPQMADGADVVAAVDRVGLTLFGLVPNLRGLEAAVAAGLDGIGLLTAASDTFNERNIGATVDESLERIRQILEESPPEMETRAYVSTFTHCPYEGPTDPHRVALLVRTLIDWGVNEVFLGDTLGKATVANVEAVFEALGPKPPIERLGVHFHDTFGQAIANIVLSLDAGISRIDASAGGLGGCPYAPGAAGNVATEDVLFLLDSLGISHGIDLMAVATAARDFCERNDLPYRSRAGEAMLAAAERNA